MSLQIFPVLLLHVGPESTLQTFATGGICKRLNRPLRVNRAACEKEKEGEECPSNRTTQHACDSSANWEEVLRADP